MIITCWGKVKQVWGVVMAIAVNVAVCYGQLTAGADVVSRYVWRGIDFGDSPSIQPTLEYSVGGLTVGTWSAYPFASGVGVNEHDVYASYSLGSLEVGVTDYFFPDGADYFDYGKKGNHVIEPYVSYSGQVSLLAAANLLNDPDNSLYFELGYSKTGKDLDFSLFVGGTTGRTELYGAGGAGLLSVGVTASKGVRLTSDFVLPLFVSYILNPSAEKTYLTFGISL